MNLYSLCNQTVTVYRKDGQRIVRTVLPKVFLDRKVRRKVDRVGDRHQAEFLLVVPGETQSVFVGDKVVPGEGPELSCGEFDTLTGCCCVKWAGQKFWNGKAVHTEAGA